MKKIIVIISFITLSLLITLIIPDSIFKIVISVHGDGEDAMDQYMFIALGCRLALSLLISCIVFFAFSFFMKKNRR
jgi:uncharacterized BrkB/YihY/UPF0761 family membrane protein